METDMQHVNRAELIGNLGSDPDVRHTQAGKAVVNLSIATSSKWKNEHGVSETKTEWHRVVIFNDKIGEIAQKHLRKGHLVRLVGALQTRKWHDEKAGVDRWSTEIVLGGWGAELTLLQGRPADRSDPDQEAA
jgi:single-strand DNA-binding protein